MAFLVRLSFYPIPISRPTLKSSSSLSLPLACPIFSPYSSAAGSIHPLHLIHFPPVSSSAHGSGSELSEEESKFVPLNADDPVYGPPALLLLGFQLDEAAKIRQLLQEMGGEFLQVIFCTEDMIPRTLWEAVNTSQPNLQEQQIAKSLPRICILSGLSGEEMVMFIDAFPESGLESAVFAALVPNSADKPLQELIDEIMADHEMMSQKQTG